MHAWINGFYSNCILQFRDIIGVIFCELVESLQSIFMNHSKSIMTNFASTHHWCSWSCDSQSSLHWQLVMHGIHCNCFVQGCRYTEIAFCEFMGWLLSSIFAVEADELSLEGCLKGHLSGLLGPKLVELSSKLEG